MSTEFANYPGEDDVVAEWRIHRHQMGLKDSSTKRSIEVVESLARHAGCPAHLATPPQIRHWLDRPRRPQKRRTGRTGGPAFDLRHVRPFFNYAVDEGIIATNPCARVKVKGVDDPQNTASTAQIEVLRKKAKAAGLRDHALVELSVASGARRSEIGLATFTDARIYLHQSKFRISESKTKSRIVPLTADAERALRRYLRLYKAMDDSELLWRSQGSAAFAVNGPNLVERTIARHSNDELSSHAIRRWRVGELIKLGMSPVSIGQLMGWSPATMTRMLAIYTKAVSHELMIEEFRRLYP